MNMPTIKSVEELKKLKEEALKKRQIKTQSASAQIIVGMGTCGIAAGARETMKSILQEIESKELTGILVTQTGCIGVCEREPIMQVAVGDGEKVSYGKVTPEVARRIIQEHVLEGRPVLESKFEI
jgi:NADP-reducing hydrogenase subunit HndB